MALLSLLCGLRAGEIHTLTWADINFEEKNIFLRDPKNTHNRYAFMTDEVKVMLQGRYGAQEKNDFVFPAANGRRRQWVSDTFPRVIQELGFNDGLTDPRQRVVFHTLRHTFASWLVQKGTPLYTVAELMGHNTLVMARRYAHLAPDTLQKSALLLEGMLG